jgi:hypothetical protein
MIPLSKCLGECFGQRNDVIVCLIGFTASSVLCELAPNLAVLLAYGDVFKLVGLVFLLAIPLVLLLGSPQAMPSRSNP